MIRSGTVACFACYVDLCVGGCISTRAQFVVLAQVGRMAIRAHVIPGLVDTGPVQRIRRRDSLARVEKEPTPASTLARPAVPCDSERLQASARHGYQILLQWIDAKRVLDFVITKGAVGTVSTDHELRVPSKEG